MAKLVWDKSGEHLFETGVDHGVVYPQAADGTYPLGVAWNGLTSVSESPSGAEATALWADNIKYLNLYSAEEFGATVEAYTYPDEFAVLDGSAEVAPGVMIGQQARKAFGLSYRTVIGNDIQGNDYGYKLHIIYGAQASPSEKAYETINDSPAAITFSWELNTTPVNVEGFKPTASLVIDSTKVDAANLATLEDILYGTDGTNARLPLPDEIAAIFGTEVGSVTLSTDSFTMTTTDAPVTLNATVKPSSAEITWTSSDTSVATVSNGVVSAVGEGTAVIIAGITVNEVYYYDSCSVVVSQGN